MASISTTVVKENHDGNTVTVVREGTKKTETSMRSLPFTPYTLDFFTNVKSRQDMNREVLGSKYDCRYLDFVCVNNGGMLLNPDFVTQKFSKIQDQYGLRHIRFHDLRHPYVKHTTKKYSLQKQKSQATVSDNLGFLFLL